MEGVGVVVSLVVGIGLVAFASWVFLFRGGYSEEGEVPDSLEHAHLRRVAEARVSALCPGAIRLAEGERAGFGDDPAPAREFWRRFAGASAMVEDDPAAALGELRGLPGLLEEALRGAGVAEGVAEREDGR